jgi:hypothetical protein
MKIALVALLAASVLGGCATTNRMSDAERLALYSAHAGAPVRDIRYTDPISWEKIDDHHMLLTMRPSEAWLLRIGGPCLAWGGSSPTIIIDNSLNQLSAGFDNISVPGLSAKCRIEEIRPVDVAAVRAARNQASGAT